MKSSRSAYSRYYFPENLNFCCSQLLKTSSNGNVLLTCRPLMSLRHICLAIVNVAYVPTIICEHIVQIDSKGGKPHKIDIIV